MWPQVMGGDSFRFVVTLLCHEDFVLDRWLGVLGGNSLESVQVGWVGGLYWVSFAHI